MTPAELRATLNETIDAWRRSFGDTRKANAKIIRDALTAHPWLHDQVPYSVQDAIYGRTA